MKRCSPLASQIQVERPSQREGVENRCAGSEGSTDGSSRTQGFEARFGMQRISAALNTNRHDRIQESPAGSERNTYTLSCQTSMMQDQGTKRCLGRSPSSKSLEHVSYAVYSEQGHSITRQRKRFGKACYVPAFCRQTWPPTRVATVAPSISVKSEIIWSLCSIFTLPLNHPFSESHLLTDAVTKGGSGQSEAAYGLLKLLFSTPEAQNLPRGSQHLGVVCREAKHVQCRAFPARLFVARRLRGT